MNIMHSLSLTLCVLIASSLGKSLKSNNHGNSGSIYVEYLPGTGGLPVILAAPHGGTVAPASIPNRDAGCWNSAIGDCVWSHSCGVKDTARCAATTTLDINTYQLTIELRDNLCALFQGSCPAAILNLLHRSKFDANRDLGEATFGVPEVVDAFNFFHSYIENEKTVRGLFFDIHGHGHAIQRAELGYLLTGAQLDSPNTPNPNITSIRTLASRAGVPFEELLRGPASFGGQLEEQGFRAVPSPRDRGPAGEAFFSGGYNTRRHGSVDGGGMDGIQIESARQVRDLPIRVAYAQALALVIRNFVCEYYRDEEIMMTSSSNGVELPEFYKACS